MTQTRQLFGTDGIRGVAEEFPLTRASVYWIGRALGHDLVRGNPRARVVIGQDTRVSSRWIADRFLQGLASVGVETRSAGVITSGWSAIRKYYTCRFLSAVPIRQVT